MNTPLTIALVTASLAFAVLTGSWAARDRPTPSWQFLLAGVVEVIALVLVVVTAVSLAGDHSVDSPVLFIAYLAGLLLVLPVGGLLALAEPSRYGSAVFAVAAIVIPVLVARMAQLWSAGHG